MFVKLNEHCREFTTFKVMVRLSWSLNLVTECKKK